MLDLHLVRSNSILIGMGVLILTAACSPPDPYIEPDALDHVNNATEIANAPKLGDFFQRFVGSWQSPCLYEPERLTGPTSGDYVRYVITVTRIGVAQSYQDYLNADCSEEWPYGNGSSSIKIRLSEKIVTESGLAAAVVPLSKSIEIIESVIPASTSSSGSSGTSGSVDSVVGFRSYNDIMHVSEEGVMYLGDASLINDAVGSDEQTPPTRLNFNVPWSWINPDD